MILQTNNKKIHIFDDVYDSHHTQKFYDFIINSYFKITLNDLDNLDYVNQKFFGSIYTKEDINKIGIINFLPEYIKKDFNINIDSCDRCLVNAVSSTTPYYAHDDSGNNAKLSFLYYANLKWDLEWGADTLFLENDRKTISNIVQCKPNRVVIFDATIPHIIRPSTQIAPHYRFSINMTFK